MEFYDPVPPTRGATQVTPYSGQPQVMQSSGSIGQDVESMFAEGYGLIGAASFTGAAQDTDQAVQEALNLKASHVVVYSRYQSTIAGAVMMPTPTTTTYNTTGTVGGTGFQATTTQFGTGQTMLPYAIDRYDQSAEFFGPLARTGLGVLSYDMPPEIRSQTGTNYGTYIRAVRKESPAFVGGIVPQDVILAVDGQSVTPDNFGDIIGGIIGKPAVFSIWRNGKQLSKTIAVPTTW